LERHPSLDDRFDPAIRIVDYDPDWPALADAEIHRVADELGDVAVRLDHVGSTAVPGLAAKPIIDLQMSVAGIERVDEYRAPLERLGYLFVPDPDAPDFHLFALPAERPRTHHLHVCESGSDHERRHLAVRDHLRTHPEAAAAWNDRTEGGMCAGNLSLYDRFMPHPPALGGLVPAVTLELLELLVGGEGQELDEVVAQGHSLEE
jgi:GrpB-like predicted nucleotidyltransferase (UPF0157 family)